MKFSSRFKGFAVLCIALTAFAALTAVAVAVGPFSPPDRSADLASEINPDKPKNVILLIGDGTDEQIITAARNYEKGAAGRFALDDLPFVGDMTTYGLKVGPGPQYPIEYVSDSAPTASAWSTGHKTVDGRLSQGPSGSASVPGTDYQTVLEQFAADGRRTGDVSTAEVTDATPAAAASHINIRTCQGPTDMTPCTAARKSNGGKGSIAEQLVDNKVDVILGGGLNRFNQTTDAGPTVLSYAQNAHGYNYLNDKTQLSAVTSLDNGPVLGLFTAGNMTPRYSPLVATTPPGTGSTTTKCSLANRGSEPTLADMTHKAIELLDNDKGFFLQVESALIDKAEHNADICGAMGEVDELDDALKVALDYYASNPDTLIVITGDHAHSTQIVPNNSAGRQTATVETADGDPMYVAYSTQATGASHTGATVRVAAIGPQAANITGLIDETDLYSTLVGHNPSKLSTGPTGPAGANGTNGTNGSNGKNGATGIVVRCRSLGRKRATCRIPKSLLKTVKIGRRTSAKAVRNGKTVGRGSVFPSGRAIFHSTGARLPIRGTLTLVVGGRRLRAEFAG